MSDAPDFVVFSDDWGDHPSSAQHLFSSIALRSRVLWVNTVGMRAPRFTRADAGKAIRKVARMLRYERKRTGHERMDQTANLRVIQPPMLPLPRLGLARTFNDVSCRRAVAAAMREWEMASPVVVTTVPNVCDVVSQFDASRLIYYCVDDFSAWPGNDQRVVRAMEARLLEVADVLIATSERLQTRLAGATGKSVSLLPHGVDVMHFSRGDARPHADLAGVPRPIAAFYGLVDERIDQTLLASVAALLPHWTFVIAGPVVADLHAVSRLPNVRMLGAVPYRDLPTISCAADALILPYRVDAFTHTISPLKLNEYLLSGTPIVAAPLTEVVKRADLLSVAVTAEEWRVALERAVTVDRTRRRADMRVAVGGRDWSAVAEEFAEVAALGSAQGVTRRA